MSNDKRAMAFFAGQLQGWISLLESSNSPEEIKSVIINMKKESNRLAKLAGVKIDPRI